MADSFFKQVIRLIKLLSKFGFNNYLKLAIANNQN